MSEVFDIYWKRKDQIYKFLKSDIQSKLRYLENQKKWYEENEMTVKSDGYCNVIHEQIKTKPQLEYLDSDLRDFKMFNDSLNMQIARERKIEGLE